MGSFLINLNSDDVQSFSAGLSSVRGSLKKCSNYWKVSLEASQFVQNIVDESRKLLNGGIYRRTNRTSILHESLHGRKGKEVKISP